MPGRDRTGPRGMGPMTGRGAGYCAGFARGRGFGAGRGFGRGRGFGGGQGFLGGRGFGLGQGYKMAPGFDPFLPPAFDPMPQEEELELLKNQAERVEKMLSEIHDRIKTLQTPKA